MLTGASSGIGRALALELARRGVSQTLVARRGDVLREVAESCRVAFGRAEDHSLLARGVEDPVHIVAGDVAATEVRDEAISSARDRWGGLDLLINNAGISAHGRFQDASTERLRRIMEVNFFAAVELTRTALPDLCRGDDPVVVNIGSILGRRGVPFNSEYCASKFALAGWSEAIRPELARHGVDVLLVNPGTTETEFFDHLIEKTGETPWKKTKGVAAETVARKIARAIERHKTEIVPSMRGQMLLGLTRLAPRFVDRMMKRFG